VGDSLVNYEKVLIHFGCFINFSPIDCLRAVPATEILDFITEKNLAFAPVVGDGTCHVDVRPSLVSGEFADVPVLIGTNADEFRVFSALVGINNGTSFIEDLARAASIAGLPSLPPLFGDVAGRALESVGAGKVDDTYLAVSRCVVLPWRAAMPLTDEGGLQYTH
jgi:hypothetical protein